MNTNKFCYYLMDSMNTMVQAFVLQHLVLKEIMVGVGMPRIWVILRLQMEYIGEYILEPLTITRLQFPIDSRIPSSTTDITLYPVFVMVDVNGQAKGPNCSASAMVTGWAAQCAVTTSCASKPDTFYMTVRYDGKLQVGGSMVKRILISVLTIFFQIQQRIINDMEILIIGY